jgi:hypothetical protein
MSYSENKIELLGIIETGEILCVELSTNVGAFRKTSRLAKKICTGFT